MGQGFYRDEGLICPIRTHPPVCLQISQPGCLLWELTNQNGDEDMRRGGGD